VCRSVRSGTGGFLAGDPRVTAWQPGEPYLTRSLSNHALSLHQPALWAAHRLYVPQGPVQQGEIGMRYAEKEIFLRLEVTYIKNKGKAG